MLENWRWIRILKIQELK